jgi:hypothetical protein
MARRRFNSTAAAMPMCQPSTSEYSSKSVREIDNGFVVSESCQKDGEYTSREYFTKNPAGRGPSAGGESLSGAIAECNK